MMLLVTTPSSEFNDVSKKVERPNQTVRIQRGFTRDENSHTDRWPIMRMRNILASTAKGKH